MVTKKVCYNCGEELGRVALDDLPEYNWTAFQIPAGRGKVYCFCQKEECQKAMFEKIKEEYNKARSKTLLSQTKKLENYLKNGN